MKAHTPGPWKVYHLNTEESYRTNEVLIHTFEVHTVNGEHDNAIGQANSRLIAAAPELLTSLQEMINVLRGGITTKADQKEFDNSGTVIKALQAITKATNA